MGFNTTLTARVIKWRLFLSKATDYFSHMLLAEVRGENMPERKFASTGSRTHNHQVMSPTGSLMSYPVRAILFLTTSETVVGEESL